MITSTNIEKLDNSKVKLTVTVSKDAAQNAFDVLLKKYCSSVQMKGFRKGKVPANILLQKYGESITYEASMNLIEDSLKKAYDEVDDKPLGYASPELKEEALIKPGEDFTYTVEYDVYPEIEIGEYKGRSIEVPEVKIEKKDIDAELERLREQNAVVQEKKDGITAKDSIVTVNYSELDENGNPVEGTERQDFVFTVGTGYNYYKIDDEVTGMKKDEEKILDKTFPEDFEIKDLAGTTKKLKVKVTAIKEKMLPELDDELAQDINDKFETLKDLKEDIKNKFQEDIDNRLRQNKVDSLLNEIAKDSTIPLPESMINAELDNQWRNFMMQSRMPEEQLLQILQIQGKTKEDLFSDWRENAASSLKKQLIVSNLVEKEKIELDDAAYEQELVKQAEKSGMKIEDFKDYITKNRLEDYIKVDIKNDRLLDLLLESAIIKKGKKLTYTEFISPEEAK